MTKTTLASIYDVESTLKRDSAKFDRHVSWERILRSKGQHFVGRTQELAAIMSVLKGPDAAAPCKPRILVCGAPGIGKSYLAIEVVHLLCQMYKTQAWLSCSRSCDLQHDLRLLSDLQTLDKASNMD